MSKRSKAQIESPSKLSSTIPPNPYAWKVLRQDQLSHLDTLIADQVESYLAELFSLGNYEVDLKQSSILEFYVSQYWWASRERSLAHEQLSTYFTIVYNLFNSLKNTNVKLYNLVDELKNCLNQTTHVFDEELTKEIMSHIKKTLIENYRIYQFVLTESQQEQVIIKELTVECPIQLIKPYPAPLDEAVPEDIYNRHILKIIQDETIPNVDNVEEEEEAKKYDDIELTDQVVKEIQSRFGDISIEEAKRIIIEVTDELVSDLKAEVKSKFREQQSAKDLSKKKEK